MRPLKPFFTYFGGKFRAAKRYSKPTFSTVVEPFAGSAGYSLLYSDHHVVLNDLSPVISGLWEYLIRVSESEIRSLPLDLQHVDNLHGPQEAKWLIGFWFNKGSAGPRLTPSAWMRSRVRPKSYWCAEIRDRIAQQLFYIRHWTVSRLPYEELPNQEATWFVDPPYQHESGRLYKHKVTDYSRLAEWCHIRKGQVIVCEREGATWLPFEESFKIKATPGSRGKGHSTEVVWQNEYL